MIINHWCDDISMNDGTYYRLRRCDSGHGFSLESWADDGSAEFGGHMGADICEVSESAFDNFDDTCIFAKQVAKVLECDPVTIIRSLGS